MKDESMDPDVGGLSAEQRSRISQKFRAAKALLDRKRSRHNLGTPDRGPRNTSGSFKRVPLTEVSTNIPLPDYGSGMKGTYIAGVNIFCDAVSVNEIKSIHNCSSTRKLGERFTLTSDDTPIRQTVSSRSNESLPSPVLLDDDFDEAVLQEIDILCEKRSASKGCEDDSKNHARNNLNNGSSLRNNPQNMAMSTVQKCSKVDALGSQHLNVSRNEESRISEATTRLIEGMRMEYSKYLQSLNEKQREAACSYISIPVIIVAGPGSGKTSTIVGRVLMLLNEGIAASNILAMTFTTAAASEMRDRIGAVAGKSLAKDLIISTFHSFSLQLCRLHAEKLNRTPDFLIYGNRQQSRAVIEAMRLLEDGKDKSCEVYDSVNPLQFFKDKSKRWQKFVSQAKASGRNPADCHKMSNVTGAAILQNYNDILKSCNALDYHDLINCSVKLLSDFPEVFKECQESWKAIVVDEFQDTSAMQYVLLKLLSFHHRITIVGDEDQSIFGFNGADVTGFDSFRKDFPIHKEIRLEKNYRSTRCIVEAASHLIQFNNSRCRLKNVLTDNSSGSKITVKECHNEDAQCAFIVDKILEFTSDASIAKSYFGNIAILYRRQVSGKVFQAAFRERKIPFNIHGVAFYRKKVVKSIIALLKTTFSDCDDGPYRQAFKALLPCEKEEKNNIISHIDKVSNIRKRNFISVARDIFTAKVSGTFKRSQLSNGRKVLSTLDIISKLVYRESVSAVITSVANMLPQKYLLEQRAVVDVDGGKFLNEDCDIRCVLQYLLDDLSDFLSTHVSVKKGNEGICINEKGCVTLLKSFIDHISEREWENFRSRRHENEDSVTLTTIHQSKGLEWDIVFIVKVNESEIPLLHEFNGVSGENSSSVEEERRLLYVAMTRARKKLFILYVTVDSFWQLLQPSRFLKEIPHHLREVQNDLDMKELQTKPEDRQYKSVQCIDSPPGKKQISIPDALPKDFFNIQNDCTSEESALRLEECIGNQFLKRFSVEDRAAASHLFHQWGKKRAFHEPKRLLDKVGFVIDERLRVGKTKNKDFLRTLKSCLGHDEAFQYANYVLKWEQIPADQRAYLKKEKQDYFQKQRIENSMGSSAPTCKQISYLQTLGCTVVPNSRLHASHLIEQYKSL